MSVIQVPLHITTKRNIPDNLGHKEYSTHSPHPNIYFVIYFYSLLPTTITNLYRATRKLTNVGEGQ